MAITMTPTEINISAADYAALTAATANLNPITWSTTVATVPKENPAVEKLDRHVDQLEEDIEYFNNKLKDITEQLEIQVIKNADLKAKVEQLEKDKDNLNCYIDYVNNKMNTLENTLNQISAKVIDILEYKK